MNHFPSKLENVWGNVSFFSDLNEKTLFGVKVLDILNCCASSNFHTLLLHNNENNGFKLQTDYELRDINVLEALPTIGVSLTSTSEVSKISHVDIYNAKNFNNLYPAKETIKCVKFFSETTG